MAKIKTYDLICIGGGSAGFNAARVAAGLGKKVAIVDGAKKLGGLCILRGCMPSKTLIYAAEILHLAQHADRFGLKVTGARADMRAIHARKKRIIADFAQYRTKALTSGKFALHHTYARFVDAHTLALSDGTQIRGKHFLLGTGSKVSVPPVPGLAETKCWTSDEVLDLDFLPKSVIVLGGGIVACELAQYLNRVGSKVTLIQRSPNILRDHSDEASDVVQRALVDEGIELFAGTQIQQIAGN
ncbi:MAG: NAD(P)/FAD-dependent oxidoreductase, partial [Lacunisphaera sp.]